MGKFDNKEKSKTTKGAAKDMTTLKANRKQMSMNVDEEIYEKFQLITKRIGTNASAVLNEYMYRYVKEHEDLI